MKQFAAIEWQRARRTLASAEQLLASDADSAASRALRYFFVNRRPSDKIAVVPYGAS